MWAKIGSNIKTFNDVLTKFTTPTSIDKETWQIYAERNCKDTGVKYAEQDEAPYILPYTPATTNLKKLYL